MLWRLIDPTPAIRQPPAELAMRSGSLALQAPGAALVVDNDSKAAAPIATALRECGWHAQTVDTIAEARSRLRTLKPRIVLIDMWQPDGSGIAFVRELAGRADVGIIVISKCNDLADRVVGLELGADDYIAKPLCLRELKARVGALARRMVRQPVRTSIA